MMDLVDSKEIYTIRSDTIHTWLVMSKTTAAAAASR